MDLTRFGEECSFRLPLVRFPCVPPRPAYLKGLGQVITGHGIEVVAAQSSLTSLQLRMSHVLSGIEGVRWRWCEAEFAWKIEYGTRPSELLPQNIDAILLHGKKWAGIHAAMMAKTWFPANDDEEDANLADTPKWCVLEIRVYEDSVDSSNANGVFLHFNRMTGCRIAFYHILGITKREFATTKEKKG